MNTGPRIASMAWRNLWRNSRRTLLTLSALVFGIFLSILMTSLQDRSFSDMIDTASKMGGGHVVIQHHEYLDTPTLTRTVEKTSQVRQTALENPKVERVVERIVGSAMLSTASHNAGVFFTAFDPAAEDETTLSFLEGSVDGELLSSTTGTDIVVGTKLAKNLRVGLGDKVVYTLVNRHGEIVGGMARVSGIVGTGADSVDAALILLPIDRVREVLGYQADEATLVAAYLTDNRLSKRVATELQPHLPPTARALTWYEVQPDLSGFIAMKVGGGRFMELFILMLISASIFNTLFVSVMERMREFGIMRAIGWTPGQLFGLVIWESLWLSLVGVLGGFLVTIGPYTYLAKNGIDLTETYGDQPLEVAGTAVSMVLEVGIFPENVALIAIAAVLATLLAGLYPAWRAGRVQPIDTIKLQ